MALCTDEEAYKIFQEEMNSRQNHVKEHPQLYKEYWFDRAPPDIKNIGGFDGVGVVIGVLCLISLVIGMVM